MMQTLYRYQSPLDDKHIRVFIKIALSSMYYDNGFSDYVNGIVLKFKDMEVWRLRLCA